MEVSGDDYEDKTEDEESKSTMIDVGLAKFAEKMPIFEPDERAGSSNPPVRPLTVNLDLTLYKAKVLARSYRYAEAEQILQKVCI